MQCLKINPFVFLTANAIQSSKDAAVVALDLFTHVTIEDGIDWIYKGLSYEPGSASLFGTAQPVDSFEVAHLAAMTSYERMSDVLYVDENGLYNNQNDVWVVVRGAWQPFAGAALVCGTTRSGNTCSPKNVDENWLKENVIVLCQNLIYIPRVERVGVVRGRAVQFASNVEMWRRGNTFWTDPNILA